MREIPVGAFLQNATMEHLKLPETMFDVHTIQKRVLPSHLSDYYSINGTKVQVFYCAFH